MQKTQKIQNIEYKIKISEPVNNSQNKNLHPTRIKYLLSKLKYWQKL